MLSAKQGNYWYHFYNVFGMTRSLTRNWTWDLRTRNQHSTTRLSMRRFNDHWMRSKKQGWLTIYTMAHLLIVAGLACDRLSTSKINLIPGARLILSPLARHRTLESSRTVFKFSTHIVSTGPSSTSQRQSVIAPVLWSLSIPPSVSVSLSPAVVGYNTNREIANMYLYSLYLM